MLNLVCRVLSLAHYRAGPRRWHRLELLCLNDGLTRFLEWETPSRVGLTVNTEPITLESLNISGEELEAVAKSGVGKLAAAEQTFAFKESHRGSRNLDGTKAGAGSSLHFFNFVASGGAIVLTIEREGKVGDGAIYSASIFQFGKGESIEILALGT